MAGDVALRTKRAFVRVHGRETGRAGISVLIVPVSTPLLMSSTSSTTRAGLPTYSIFGKTAPHAARSRVAHVRPGRPAHVPAGKGTVHPA
jgi:hypothetical protein